MTQFLTSLVNGVAAFFMAIFHIFTNPINIAVLTVLVFILILIFAQGAALQAANVFERWISALNRLVSGAWNNLQQQWQRQDLIEWKREQAIAEAKKEKEAANEKWTKEDAAAIQPQTINQNDLVLGWTFRLFYVLAFSELAVAEFVIVAPRVSAIIFNQPLPAFFNVLNPYLGALTSLLFIFSAILAAMSMVDTMGHLPDAVKLNPRRVNKNWQKATLILSIVMFVIAIITLISLAIAASLMSTGSIDKSFQNVITAVVTISASILVFLAAFLGFDGFLNGFALVLGFILLVIAFVLMVVLAIPLHLLRLLFVGFDKLNLFITDLFRREYSLPARSISKDYSVVGFGATPSALTAKLAKQLVTLYGHRNLWMVGIYINSGDFNSRRKELLAPSIHEIDISINNIGNENPASLLIQKIRTFIEYPNLINVKGPHHLIWVLEDSDFVKYIGQLKEIQKIKNLKITFILILKKSYEVPATFVDTLKKWFDEPESNLGTTIVIDERSDFWKATKDVAQDLLARSLAGFIGASYVNNHNVSFTDRMQSLRDDGCMFAGLSCGSAGDVAFEHNFRYYVNPNTANDKLQLLTKKELDEQVLSTTTKKFTVQQNGIALNLVMPSDTLKPMSKFTPQYLNWLQDQFGINITNVNMVQSRPRDIGVDICDQFANTFPDLVVGKNSKVYFYHLTTLYGFPYDEEIPRVDPEPTDQENNK